MRNEVKKTGGNKSYMGDFTNNAKVGKTAEWMMQSQ
jgi:hypothetical protein